MDVTLNPAQRNLGLVIRDASARIVGGDARAAMQHMFGIGFIEFALPRGDGGLGFGTQEFCIIFEEFGVCLIAVRFIRSALLVLDLWGAGTQAGLLPQAAELMRSSVVTVDAGAILPHIGLGSPEQAAGLLLREVPAEPGLRAWSLSRAAGLREPVLPTTVCTVQEAERILDRDRVRTAAYLTGVARRGLELARARASGRLLGGRPLIERQAVAHLVARAAMATETAGLEVLEAACQENGAGQATHLYLTALATAMEAAITCAHTAVQIYGAAGTSCTAITEVYDTAYAAPGNWGPPSALWCDAAARRYAAGTQADDLSATPTTGGEPRG
jgi:alkylation response protein AidB-like acyl-CoA dehydrogenase